MDKSKTNVVSFDIQRNSNGDAIATDLHQVSDTQFIKVNGTTFVYLAFGKCTISRTARSIRKINLSTI